MFLFQPLLHGFLTNPFSHHFFPIFINIFNVLNTRDPAFYSRQILAGIKHAVFGIKLVATKLSRGLRVSPDDLVRSAPAGRKHSGSKGN
jgi:hypothetical protein